MTMMKPKLRQKSKTNPKKMKAKRIARAKMLQEMTECKAEGAVLLKKDPTDSEKKVAECLKAIEAATNSEDSFQKDIARVTILRVKEIATRENKTALAIFVPYKIYLSVVKRNKARLIGELEKKMKCHVVFIAQRRILPKSFDKKHYSQFPYGRPPSRTSSAVKGAMLEDIVHPSDIVGKRIRVRADGSVILKVFLDPRDKKQDGLQEKLESYSDIYTKMTRTLCSVEFAPPSVTGLQQQ
eukprot:Trichotokara_eunicae@DN4489_c0_g1_i1.p1